MTMGLPAADPSASTRAGQVLSCWELARHYGVKDADGAQPHWVAALQGRVPLLPTAELALATMLISEGIYLSNKLGREVTAEEVRENSVSTAVAV